MVESKDKINHNTGKCKNGKCPYPICALKTGNDGKKCAWKIICSAIAYINIAKDYSLFTGITIFLFLFPTAIDLFYYKSRSKFITFAKFAVLLMDIFILIVSFSTVFGFMKDNIYDFVVNHNAIIFNGNSITKKIMYDLMLLNIPMIILCYIGSPAFDNSLISNITKAERFQIKKQKEA